MGRGWFGPRKWGWGASPASWEGWLTTALFILAIVGVSVFIPSNSAASWIAGGVLLVIFFVVVALTYRSDARTSL